MYVHIYILIYVYIYPQIYIYICTYICMYLSHVNCLKGTAAGPGPAQEKSLKKMAADHPEYLVPPGGPWSQPDHPRNSPGNVIWCISW